MAKITWPVVALVALVLAAFVGIFALIPDNEPASRTALLAVITLAGNGVVAFFVNGRVAQVEEKVDRTVRQTNGGLDRRMRAAVESVVNDGSSSGNAGVLDVGQSGAAVQPPGVAYRDQGTGPGSWGAVPR